MKEIALSAQISGLFSRRRFFNYSDWLAVAVAVSLPWSTTASGILIALWSIAILPTIDLATLRRSVVNAASAFPIALCVFALLGMTWGNASLLERLMEFKVYIRLPAIALLLIQFQRSDHGIWVIGGFFSSCSVLLLFSSMLFLFPEIPWRTEILGVPVKDYVIQSSEFLICAFGLAHFSLCAWNRGRPMLSLALASFSFFFLINIAFVATGRSTLIAFLVLVLVMTIQRFQVKRALILVTVCASFLSASLMLSPYLRDRIIPLTTEMREDQRGDAITSVTLRLEFWRKSIGFFVQAPFVGHGIGSTRELFRVAAVGEKGVSSIITDNPHQQTLNVLIQLGVIGVALLYAMWMSHFVLFRGHGLWNWLGLGVVVHSFVLCLFNSYLFESTLGWIYVFGVGVLGGMALRNRSNFLGGVDKIY